MDLSRYANVFGAPKTGLHSYRVLNIAIFDLILTIAVAILISNYFGIKVFITLTSLLIMGIVLHYLFNVPTTINKVLTSLF
jgi:hypothetical protein